MRQRKGSGRPTIADVAREADVGAITVSRAIRNPGQVSAELRERIEAAIRRLNYVPDPQAQVLASGRSNVIGVILPSLTNIVFGDVLQGIYDRIEGSGFHIQIGNTRYSVDEEDRLVALFAGQRAAAMLLTGIDQSVATCNRLAEAGVPVVQIMEYTPRPIDMLVGVSHADAGRAAVDYLLSRGYRRIGFLGARMDPRMLRRRDGYRAALQKAGLYDPALEISTPAPSGVARGRALCSQLLAAAPDVDAAFCANDDIALGVMFECTARAIPIPERMGIVGFNDLDMTASAVPAITGIRVDRYQMGLRAIGMLLARLADDDVAEPCVDLGFELIPRQTTR